MARRRLSWLSHRVVRRGLIMVGALYAIALFGPMLSPHDPAEQPTDIFAWKAKPPSLSHPFGTDRYGRDLLTRVLSGGRVSLIVALSSVVLAVTIGTIVGASAGLSRGFAGHVLMRIVDAGLAIPRVFLVLAILSLWNSAGAGALIAILGTTGWFTTSRLVRAEVLSLRGRDFMAAAHALGIGPWRTLWRHVLPNVLAPVIVTATLGIGNVILVEAGLSYLGVGIKEPGASWGTIIAGGRDFLYSAPWMTIIPGLAVVATVMIFATLGEGLQKAINPRET